MVLARPFFASHCLRSTLRAPLTRRLRLMATASMTLAVKGDPDNKVLGDCPFCHRVLLTLEQKALGYDRIYIDFSKKPQWLLDVNPNGTVPVLNHDGEYVVDSGTIVEYLEEKFPEPAVPDDPEGMKATEGIFGAFREYFVNKDDSQEADLKEKLNAEMRKLEARLKEISGPFLGGTTFNAADALILPRLYHCRVALSHFKDYSLPEDCPTVKQYIEAAEATEEWKRCLYTPDLIIKGWGAKL